MINQTVDGDNHHFSVSFTEEGGGRGGLISVGAIPNRRCQLLIIFKLAIYYNPDDAQDDNSLTSQTRVQQQQPRHQHHHHQEEQQQQ